MALDQPALARYLIGLSPEQGEHEWDGWQLQPLASGNNRLWRATRPDAPADWVVKLTIKDDRDRARREHGALTLMAQAAPGVAPRPLYLDADGFDLGVVVQTYAPGEPLWGPPPDDEPWLKVVRTYARLHAASRPDGQAWNAGGWPTVPLTTPAAVKADARRLAGLLPPEGQSAALTALLSTLAAAPEPGPPPAWVYGHGDPNLRNCLVTAEGVTLVDWEYSGVTDPAHELAKLMTHPVAAGAGEARWAWVADQYAGLSGGAAMRERVWQWYALRLGWWVVRLLFGRHVLLAQPSRRLVGPGPELEMTTPAMLALYFDRAFERLRP